MGLRIMKAGGTEMGHHSLCHGCYSSKEREVFLLRTTGKKRIPRNEGVTKTGNFHIGWSRPKRLWVPEGERTGQVILGFVFHTWI